MSQPPSHPSDDPPPAWLLASASDEHPDVCCRALEALERFRHPRALSAVGEALRHPHASVRQKAALALAAMGEGAIEPLKGALASDDEQVRRLSARALGRLGDRGAVFALLRALSDASAEVRRAAARALGQIGTPEALLTLRRALDDEDARVASAARRALRRNDSDAEDDKQADDEDGGPG